MGHCLFLRKGEVHTAPVTGVLASSLAVGSTVKLMEGGTAVEYLVVNQGIPENSSLYDASCDGTWLLRKDIHSNRQWNTKGNYLNTIADSLINTWLNGEFFNALGSIERTVIKQVKIPYCVGGKSSLIKSKENGLDCKVFLLGCNEIGRQQYDDSSDENNPYIPHDGAKLDYFLNGLSTEAASKRIAYMNGAKTDYYLRSPVTRTNISNGLAWKQMSVISQLGTASVYSEQGIRPTVIVPKNALFGELDGILKGVK